MTDRLQLAEKKIEELQGDLATERSRTHGMRRQIEAAAYDAANMESRLMRIARTLETDAQAPLRLTVEDVEVFIEVRELRMSIDSRLSAGDRAVFDRLYSVLDRLLARTPAT